MLPVFLLSSAVFVTKPYWPPPSSLSTARASARHGRPRAALDLDRLAAALPYLSKELLAEDVRYCGLGVTLQGREAYAAATAAWRRVLPQRLASLDCAAKTVLPPDVRRRVTARYSLEFDAPVPPQVLPAQRARLLRAGVPTSGLVSVRATIVGTLELDAEGRVCRHDEQLVTDPFDATNSMAHFELLNARATALLPDGAPPPLRAPRAYWAALRGMMRIEMEEAARRAASDELAVLGSSNVTDEDFEREFRSFIGRNLLIGALLPASVYGVAKAAAQLVSGP